MSEIVQESSSPPDAGEPIRESVPEGHDDSGAAEVTPAANARIQELVRQKKAAEAELGAARQREAQYQQYLQRVVQQQQKQKEPKSAAPDAETELIIRDLGGDDTARKLYEVLGSRFNVAAKQSGLVTADQVQQLVEQKVAQATGAWQTTVSLTNNIAEMVNSGTLDKPEAEWVTQQVATAAQQSPEWVTDGARANMLVNHIIMEGMKSGAIKPGRKQTRGNATLLSPGMGGVAQADDGFAEVKAAAKRFSTLRGLAEKDLKALHERVGGKTAGVSGGVSVREAMRGA